MADLDSDEIQALQRIADNAERRLMLQFLEMLRRVATAELERRILAALAREQLSRVIEIVRTALQVELLQYQTGLTNEIVEIERKAFSVAGDALGVGTVIGSLNLTNPEAVAFARDRGTRFAAQLDQDTQQMLRKLVSRSFTEGIPPREAAAMIRSSIGLTANQTAAIDNYRAFLEKLSGRESLEDLATTVEQRVKRSDIRLLPKTGAALSDARIEQMLGRYGQRLQRERALALVSNETIGASNHGQLVLWNHSVDRGLLIEAQVRKKWIVTHDDRLCPICKAMDGQLRRLNEDFVSSYNGERVKVPGAHQRCRCAMGLVRIQPRPSLN